MGNARVAVELRLGRRQMEEWRRAWRQGGVEALRSKGPRGRPRFDEIGQGLRPPNGRPWSRRGHRPQVRVHGGRHGARVSVAGMVCYRPGHRPRLIYRLHRYHRARKAALAHAR
ncbi:hypothetical protein GCM10022214_03980 [Actinomadura miaoliensis]|uniref:Helix-turn-helix domain-containing protein n=1 Tax=Actinomadura miaoliensis TaxID=430685 RepID=A0ABP7UYT2_9ACTN